MVQFRLLGAVEAVHSDQPVALGHARLRSVLAVLLVEANHVVSVDQLIERAWGETPPGSRNVLYSYLSRLRAVFSIDPEVRIQRRSGGYQLTVGEASVDLHRFRGLIADARTTTGDATAVALFDQALRLWHGTAFADLDTPWLAAFRAALELERQAVQMDRTDAALRCGHHAQLLAELSTQATEQPFDERIAGQLMNALAGAGRPADALLAYQHTRQALVDQLGLEPGPELRHLHERILAGATGLAPPTRTQPAAPGGRLDAVVPRQLPAATRHFTGRRAELDTLVGLLESVDGAGGAVVISAIGGMAGIGKTALAVHAAHQLADHFPDGVLFTDLRGFTPDTEPTTPEQALDRLLRGLGVPGPQIPPDLDARVGLYRSMLARRRVLIVLDNAADETQLHALLPGTPSCMAIITSRRHLAGLDDAIHLTLPLLDRIEAARLFCNLAGDRTTIADQPTVDRIVALCGYLPLAIRIAAARLRKAPAATPATLCTELEHVLDTGPGLDWLSDGHRAVAAALAVSNDHLTGDQQHVLLIAGLHPGPDLEPHAVAALADTTVDKAGDLLDELHAASLLDQPAHRRYAPHDLVAYYVRRLTAELPEPVRRTAGNRLYDYYAAASSAAMDLICPWEADHRPDPPISRTPAPTMSDGDQAQAWLDAETDNLLSAAREAATGQRADHMLHQSATLRWHLRARGHYSPAVLLYQQAVQHARATANCTGEQNALIDLGHIHHLQGRYGQATDCLEQALAIARKHGHRTGEQDALVGLGWVHHLGGRYELASDRFEQALHIAQQTGHRTGEQDALIGLGHIHRLQGRHGRASDRFEQALHIAQQTGHRTGEQDALIGLGWVHHLESRYELASDRLEQALGIAQQTGHRIGEQNALRGLGNSHHARGRYGPATNCYDQALAIARQIGYRQGEMDTLRALGTVHLVQRRYGPAIYCYDQALAIARQHGYRHGELLTLIGLGDVYYEQGRYGLATDCLDQALAIAQQLDDRNVQLEAHQGLGRVHHAAHNHPDALYHQQAALQLTVDLDQPPNQARAHDGLAHTRHVLVSPGQTRHHGNPP